MWRVITPQSTSLEKTVGALIAAREFYIGSDGRLRMNKSGAFDIPWIFHKRPARRDCYLWNHVFFQHFGLIPDFCCDYCYKIVVKPKTVKSLFELDQLLTGLGLPSKCGIDRRNYTFGPYAGFVYADGEAMGQEYYHTVSDAIKENLGYDIPVILKKGCTEMEAKLPSDKWSFTEPDRLLQRRLEDMFAPDSVEYVQGEWLKHLIRLRWVKRAIEIGDETYKDLPFVEQPDKLFVSSVTYHTKENAQ